MPPPSKLQELEPITQRSQELHLRQQWSKRLMTHFSPFAEHIPHMQPLLGPNFRTEIFDLLGDTRFRTIRQHCLAYESLRKKGFVVIPWREQDVRNLLNLLREQEVTPYKVNQVWETLRWLSRIFGLLDVNEFHRLKTKKKAMEEELADTTIKPQRKATVPSKEVIWALEEGAASLDIPDLEATGASSPEASLTGHTAIQKMMDAFILGIARFQVGCSARFNDLQHVHPKNLTQTSTTVELQAWQTKTVSTSKIRKQPVPLICPKYSFTGKPWWLPFLALVRKMVSLKQFENMD